MHTPDKEKNLLDRAEEAEAMAERAPNQEVAAAWRSIAQNYRTLAAMEYSERTKS